MAEIAILLATYNGETYLEEQIDSLIHQTFQDFKIYIHDDASTDNTVAVIEKCVKQFPDKIVSLEYGKTGGAAANFMSMIQRVSEPYIMFCDQDDFWMPDKIEKSCSKIKSMEKASNGKPCLAFTDLYVVDDKLNVISDSFMKYSDINPYRTKYTHLLVQNVAPGCTMILNRALAELAVKCDNIDNIIMHDWWIMLVAATYGELSYIDEPTIKYRQHMKNVVGAKKTSIVSKMAKIFRQIFDSSFFKKRKIGTNKIVTFASELLKVADLPEDKSDVISQLSQFSSMPKYRKIKICKQNDISTYRRNWWFLFWI